LSNKYALPAESFIVAANDAFTICSSGGKIPDEFDKLALPSSHDIQLSLAVQKSSGRRLALDYITLQGFDVYGSAENIFTLGLICWKLSILSNPIVEYAIKVSSPHGGDISAIKMLPCGLVKNRSISSIPFEFKLKTFRRVHQPLAGFRLPSADLPNFGIEEEEESSNGTNHVKTLILQQSLKGLNAFGRCLMAFAIEQSVQLEEIHFEHAHSPSNCNIGRLSYEANFYKIGSFAGDSIFSNY
jgi:hypothetical protein